ncbi:MAG: uracil-DNA glycosylase [Candidatus Calescibacterium sp.]|nr:uracil-DNA glycosylase [Candidatus Calescibacterium sp.]
MSQKLFEDIQNLFEFFDQCLNVKFFIESEKKKNELIITNKEQKQEDIRKDYKQENKVNKSIYDEIVEMHMKIGEPYMEIKEEKRKLLEDIAMRIINCKMCELHKERKKAVPGDGSPTARVVFVGEAPGYEEDKKGKPFVGKSGNLLMSKIKDILGLDRSEVFITNIVRCRPPQNRTPEKNEIEKCSPYLLEELNIIDPQLVVALGAPAAKVLLMRDEKITELRGNFYKRSDYTVFVTFHPAYVLRNPGVMDIFNEDFKKIAEFLRSI